MLGALLTWVHPPEHSRVYDAFVQQQHEIEKREKAMMSKDRVRFTLSRSYVAKVGSSYLYPVLRRAFGTKVSYSNISEGLTIVCRPSQFARFMVYRNEAIQRGELRGCNTFSEMKPELFTPECGETEIDVSKNPHCE